MTWKTSLKKYLLSYFDLIEIAHSAAFENELEGSIVQRKKYLWYIYKY